MEETFDIDQVVKVQADEVGDFQNVFIAAGAELAAEGGVVEVGGLVEACLVLVGDGMEGPGLLGGVVAGDVGEGSGEGDALVGAGVGDGGHGRRRIAVPWAFRRASGSTGSLLTGAGSSPC